MKTKESIDAVSTLIRACQAIGATYAPDKIMLADGRELILTDTDECWGFTYVKPRKCLYHRNIGKEACVKAIKILLLQIHLKILEKELADKK